MTEKEINRTNLASCNDYSKKGLILEVDLEYPKELHSLHNDCPLRAEQVKVTDNMLSEYCQKIKEKYNILRGQVHKLIPTFSNKK